MPTAADYLAFRQQGGIADLSARTKLRLTGADRVRYLNGQATANITRITPDKAMPGCITTAKGKLCGEVMITATPDSLLIDAEPELRESLMARLERYIISDDAVLEEVTEAWSLIHLLPAENQSVDSTQPADIARYFPHVSRRFGPLGLDFFVPASEAEGVIHQLAAENAKPVLLSAELLDSLRIEHGIPRWGRELDENTLPPEAGLDRTHIDYQKGCYIGQEVISRLKSVGHVNRQLAGFTVAATSPGDAEVPLAAGMRIAASADSNKEAGILTSAAYSFALSKSIALGYLKRGVPQEGLVAYPLNAESSGIPVFVHQLPFVS